MLKDQIQVDPFAEHELAGVFRTLARVQFQVDEADRIKTGDQPHRVSSRQPMQRYDCPGCTLILRAGLLHQD